MIVETDIVYRYMEPGEEEEVSDLIAAVFHEFIGCHYPPEGVREFLGYIRPELIRDRFLLNHFTLVAVQNGRIVGMTEVRDTNHVSLFFVVKELHGRGIGRGLFEKALSICREKGPDVAVIDVNSSPNSVGVYESLGFYRTGPEQTKNGITFVPMVFTPVGRGESPASRRKQGEAP
jgi:GNAT superfamily N-acetyltransferase